MCGVTKGLSSMLLARPGAKGMGVGCYSGGWLFNRGVKYGWAGYQQGSVSVVGAWLGQRPGLGSNQSGKLICDSPGPTFFLYVRAAASEPTPKGLPWHQTCSI